MRTQALSDDILLNIEKCARYIGGEVNSVVKDTSKIDVRFALCFPDVYEIGMSNLGIQIIYDLLNKFDNVYCERVFSPWPDLHTIMKNKEIPLFALESQDAIKDFDLIGISLGFELCYTNVLGILDLAKIPFHAKDRNERFPIIIGGGNCTYNPRPMEPFFDIFYLGEGEVYLPLLVEIYEKHKKEGFDKKAFLKEVATIPGLFVPGYNDNQIIVRQIVENIDEVSYPTHPVIPHIQAAQDRMVLEIQRGCIRGCRFCQAGFIYRPNREKSLNVLSKCADNLIKNTGYDEISLSSLSSGDYSNLNDFLNNLLDKTTEKGINISLPSLRIDSVSSDMMEKISDVRKSSVTFAPEAGSQRMRDSINKNLSYDEIIEGAKKAFIGGFRDIKLYFMLGLPNEEKEDILAIADLADDIADAFYRTIPKDKRIRPLRITVSTSFFVPKPFTPFQWAKMFTEEDYKQKAYMLKDAIASKVHKKNISYKWHAPDVTMIEGVFARGNTEISRVVETAYNLGCMFDAWSDYFDFSKWKDAFNTCNIDIYDYTLKGFTFEDELPWSFIDIGVTQSFLKKEYEKSKEYITTPDCKEKCSGCGCMNMNCGICNNHIKDK